MSALGRSQLIYFEVNGIGYAVEAAYLSGVAYACPYISYPGLPEGVSGIAQWSGKIYPVIPFSPKSNLDPRTSTFLFTVDGLKGPFHEVAVAVPGQVRVFFVDVELSGQSTVKDKEGTEAIVVDIRDIKNLISVKRKAGKLAA